MESGSRLKNLVVFVPALKRYSAGRPCVCEMYRICNTNSRNFTGPSNGGNEHRTAASRVEMITYDTCRVFFFELLKKKKENQTSLLRDECNSLTVSPLSPI